ncbi:MAG: ATP-dependent Clp protease ATP-binding subunit ClpA [Myxococcaceae bacterium]|nr:ATP-dependent Clp protease ATP-binding subunit ClpA [Myxococcaceae bacterium]
MVDLGGDVRALLAQAQRVAQKSGASPTSGHIVLAMLESSDDTGRLLEAHGARTAALYQSLKDVDSEASNAVALMLERARRIAAHAGASKAQTLHLLLAAVQNARSEAHRGLSALGVQVDNLRDVLELQLGVVKKPVEKPKPAGTKSIAERLRAEAGTPLPRTLIDWEAQKRLATKPRAAPNVRLARPAARENVRLVDPETLARSEQAAERDVVSGETSLEGPLESADARPSFALEAALYPLLSTLGRNLTLEAAEGKIDPVVGRDAEIEQVLDVLARRRGNNPILVGAPGVGKTAIAEGLALRLVSEASEPQRVLIELSAGSLVSGTGVRGALSDKLARLRREVKASNGRVLLFIDEIHALLSQGNEGPDDLANDLKAALARGELPCIGATTESEYRRVFERDAALARRFTRVEVKEPTRDATLAILSGVALHYERFHEVSYSRDALEAAVDLSVRYLPEQHLPDKAIGLLDRAGARARRRGASEIDRTVVAAVVSEQANVPLDRLLMRDRERLLALETHLSERVIGQRAAIARVADAVRKGAVGMRGKRPLGVFLFLGPTGVGKTELAKALNDELFWSSTMTRLDMSEYSEAHAVARLFGAPPGYVGHDEGGQLTEAVRKRPYQLVLLDEVEKAHPDVLLALLPLLDEGRLTDGRGRTVDFTNTIIVLTSNLGVSAAKRSAPVGFGASSRDEPAEERADAGARTIEAARSALRPELFNRLDEVLYFPRLGRPDVRRIAGNMLAQVAASMRREQDVELLVDDSALDALVDAGGFDAELGARPMRRTIGREVETPLATRILDGTLGPGDTVRLLGRGAGATGDQRARVELETVRTVDTEAASL